ncbi:hypothetical protein ACFX16_030817 [Malus domestica]
MQKAKKTCRDLCQDVKVETKVVNGDPRDVICRWQSSFVLTWWSWGANGYDGFCSSFPSTAFANRFNPAFLSQTKRAIKAITRSTF